MTYEDKHPMRLHQPVCKSLGPVQQSLHSTRYTTISAHNQKKNPKRSSVLLCIYVCVRVRLCICTYVCQIERWDGERERARVRVYLRVVSTCHRH